jgi:hypothetical protein
MEAIKRANKLWTNDSICSRVHLDIPVVSRPGNETSVDGHSTNDKFGTVSMNEAWGGELTSGGVKAHQQYAADAERNVDDPFFAVAPSSNAQQQQQLPQRPNLFRDRNAVAESNSSSVAQGLLIDFGDEQADTFQDPAMSKTFDQQTPPVRQDAFAVLGKEVCNADAGARATEAPGRVVDDNSDPGAILRRVDDTLADVKRKVQTYGASSRPFRL